MPSLSGPPSSYFIFNMNALPHNGPVVPHPQAAARPRSNLPVQKGPPRVQASLSTFVSTCKILWETGAVDSRVGQIGTGLCSRAVASASAALTVPAQPSVGVCTAQLLTSRSALSSQAPLLRPSPLAPGPHLRPAASAFSGRGCPVPLGAQPAASLSPSHTYPHPV